MRGTISIPPDPTHPDAVRLKVARPDPARPISVTELYAIGIGPSNSHIVGPMRVAQAFAPLALTGTGHGTDERNTVGAIKAINAACLALRGDGQHIVFLDAVSETMRQTGRDMRSQCKETSLGGLAVVAGAVPVNFVEC